MLAASCPRALLSQSKRGKPRASQATGLQLLAWIPETWIIFDVFKKAGPQMFLVCCSSLNSIVSVFVRCYLTGFDQGTFWWRLVFLPQSSGPERLRDEARARSGNPTRRSRVLQVVPHLVGVESSVAVQQRSQKHRPEPGKSDHTFPVQVFYRSSLQEVLRWEGDGELPGVYLPADV